MKFNFKETNMEWELYSIRLQSKRDPNAVTHAAAGTIAQWGYIKIRMSHRCGQTQEGCAILAGELNIIFDSLF